jgi:hypothetical protein
MSDVWQNRRLSEVIPIMFIDVVMFHKRKEKNVQIYLELSISPHQFASSSFSVGGSTEKGSIPSHSNKHKNVDY